MSEREIELRLLDAEKHETGDVIRTRCGTVLVITSKTLPSPRIGASNYFEALRVPFPDATILFLPEGYTFRAYEVDDGNSCSRLVQCDICRVYGKHLCAEHIDDESSTN